MPLKASKRWSITRTNDLSLDHPFNEERKYDEFFEVNLRSPIMLESPGYLIDV